VGAIVTFKKPTPRKQAVNAASPSRKHLNRFRMTEARVDAAPPPASGSAYYYDLDVPGLALRVTAKGVRTFVLVKKISGVTQRITLGRWPGLKLADARRAAARINGEIAAGLDPVALRRAARARAETCSDLWPLYLANIKRKNRSWERDEHRWKAEVAPRIGRKPLSSITPAECQKIVDAVGADHPIKANRIAALLGAFFAFAVKNDRVVRNPARGLSRYEEAARDRFLSGDELRAFLNACTAAPEPCDWRSAAGSSPCSRRDGASRLVRAHFTVHSCRPAENVGCMVTSIRKAPVVTGLNDTRLKRSRSTP